MSYIPMNIQDFVDTWNTEKVRYLENGILNNEYAIEQITNFDFSEEQKQTILDNLGISDINRTTALNYLYGYTYWGEKIKTPSISFDGSLEGKVIIPLSPQEVQGAEVGLCYVKISDDAIKSPFVMATHAGLYNFTYASLLESGTNSFDLSDSFSVISQDLYQQYSENTYRGYFGGILSDFDVLLSYNDSFFFNEIQYPKGTYSLLAYSLESSSTTNSISDLFYQIPAPIFYIDHIWDIYNLNYPFKNDFFSWKNLDFKKDSVLDIQQGTIKWDTISSLPSSINYFYEEPVYKIDNNAIDFIKAFQKATSIKGKIFNQEYNLKFDKETDSIFTISLEDNTPFSFLVSMPTNFQDYFISPGFYTLLPIQEIICTGVDIEKNCAKKIPPYLYNQLASEESQIDYGQKFAYRLDDSNNTSFFKIDSAKYSKISSDPINLEDVFILESETATAEGIKTVSLEKSETTIDNLTIFDFNFDANENLYFTTNQGVSGSASSCLLRLNNYTKRLEITTNESGFYIGQVGGPSKPNPDWKTKYSTAGSKISFVNIRPGSFIRIIYPFSDKTASFSVTCSPYSSNNYSYSQTTLFSPDNLAPIEILTPSTNVQTFSSGNFEKAEIINILEDNTLYKGSNLSKGLYSIISLGETTSSYISKVCTKDIIKEPTIHFLNSKFLPTEVPIVQQAAVGQILKVKSIDEEGKPVSWEAIDMPKAQSISNITSTNVTAADFNSLLKVLKEAGLMEE